MPALALDMNRIAPEFSGHLDALAQRLRYGLFGGEIERERLGAGARAAEAAEFVGKQKPVEPPPVLADEALRPVQIYDINSYSSNTRRLGTQRKPFRQL